MAQVNNYANADLGKTGGDGPKSEPKKPKKNNRFPWW